MRIIEISKPWGKFQRYSLNENSTVKTIQINPLQKLSLQSHKKRDEFWKILKGIAIVTINNERKIAKEGDTFFIKKNVKHRIEAKNKTVVFLEISFGTFDEKDEIRFEDKYNRK